MKDILHLVCLKLKRKWKNSLLFFLIIILSFSAAIVSISLLGSIERTNKEFKLNTYGEWYYAIPYGFESDKEALSGKDWIDNIGTAQSLGTIRPQKNNSYPMGIGTVDQAFIDIGRIRLDEGSFPTSADEIAMEVDTLHQLGYEAALGEKITVSVLLPAETENLPSGSDGVFAVVTKTYTLCGIIHEYSDIWNLEYNSHNQLLNSAFITQEAAARLTDKANKALEEEEQVITLLPPVMQYFISVSEENRDRARNYLQEFMTTRESEDFLPCRNSLAYSGDLQTEGTDEFYVFVIALLTLVSVLCLGIIQLPQDSQSFSTLRSLGMSKGQLALFQMIETLIIVIPAIILGIPSGAFLTWASLKLMLYSGSVDIQVDIPFEMLLPILGLWLSVIFVSRLIIAIITLRIPLVGKLKMGAAKARTTKALRSTLIVLLLCVFSTSLIFSSIQSERYEHIRDSYASYPYYKMNGSNDRPLLSEDLEKIKQVPGISEAYGFGEFKIGLSYDGMSEQTAYLLAINEEDWEDLYDFGSDKTAFHNGEFVYICVERDETVLPEDEAKLHIYSGYTKELITKKSVTPKVIYYPDDRKIALYGRTLASVHPDEERYTVVCSEQFVRNVLDELPENEMWGKYKVKDGFVYERIYAHADQMLGDLSTDVALSNLCSRRGINMDNRRTDYTVLIQSATQSLIMIRFMGICICIVSLMILCSVISLETRNEKNSFLIKRCIGMSKRQVTIEVIGKALLRCLGAFLISLIAYFLWYAWTLMSIEELTSYFSAIKCLLTDRVTYFTSPWMLGRIIITSLICLIVPLVLILFIKKDLRNDRLSRADNSNS